MKRAVYRPLSLFTFILVSSLVVAYADEGATEPEAAAFELDEVYESARSDASVQHGTKNQDALAKKREREDAKEKFEVGILIVGRIFPKRSRLDVS